MCVCVCLCVYVYILMYLCVYKAVNIPKFMKTKKQKPQVVSTGKGIRTHQGREVASKGSQLQIRKNAYMGL